VIEERIMRINDTSYQQIVKHFAERALEKFRQARNEQENEQVK